jgi:hypothetical protein
MKTKMRLINIFNEQASSSELGAGDERKSTYHDRPRKTKIIMEIFIKKQLFLKFKKFNKEGVDMVKKMYHLSRLQRNLL